MRTVEKVVAVLGPYGPDAIVALLIFLVALAAMAKGLDPWTVVPLAIFTMLMYGLRQTRGERHKERLRELDVEKAALDLQRYQASQRTKFERQRQKLLEKSKRK